MINLKKYSRSTPGVGFEFYCYYGNLSVIVDETPNQWIVANQLTGTRWTQLKHRFEDHMNSGAYRPYENNILFEFDNTIVKTNRKYLSCIL